jgi:hypothetical protein
MIGITKCDSRDRWTLAGRILLLGSVTLLAGAFCQFASGATPVAAPKPKAGEPDTKPRPKAEQAEDENRANWGELSVTAVDPMGEDRMKRITSLVAIVRSDELVTTDRTKVLKAIVRLGRMKALEAAGPILERLDLHVAAGGRIIRHGIPRMDVSYPAIKALTDIGEGALPYICDALADPKRSPRFRPIACIALIYVAGGRDKAETYLRSRLAMYGEGVKVLTYLLEDEEAPF